MRLGARHIGREIDDEVDQDDLDEDALEIGDAVDPHPIGQPFALARRKLDHEAEGDGVGEDHQHDAEEVGIGRAHHRGDDRGARLAAGKGRLERAPRLRSAEPEHDERPEHRAERCDEHDETERKQDAEHWIDLGAMIGSNRTPVQTPRHRARRCYLRYSITSSARAINDVGIVRPMAFAADVFSTSSSRWPCTTGKSLGWAPLRMRSMYTAPWR